MILGAPLQKQDMPINAKLLARPNKDGKKPYYVLGNKDPEMNMIERIITQDIGAPFIYASIDGVQCNAKSAQHATDIPKNFDPKKHNMICVECTVQGVEGFQRIDHHSAGDPGFHLGAKDFWEASSIGQLCIINDIEPTREQRLIAAMDHCFAEAVKGNCPGVAQKDVLKLKVDEIAKSSGKTVEQVNALIAHYIKLIPEKIETMHDVQIVNLTANIMDEGYNADYLAAQTAATMKGVGILVCRYHDNKKLLKYSIGGDVTEKTIEFFEGVWAKENGLKDIYAMPTRAMAGGYKSNPN